MEKENFGFESIVDNQTGPKKQPQNLEPNAHQACEVGCDIAIGCDCVQCDCE